MVAVPIRLWCLVNVLRSYRRVIGIILIVFVLCLHRAMNYFFGKVLYVLHIITGRGALRRRNTVRDHLILLSISG